MANINEINCTDLAGNTGLNACVVDVKNIVGVLIAPRGFEFDTTNLQATLRAATLNASKVLRLYPLWDFETTKDQSEDKVVQTLGTGSKQVVREGFNDWSFQFVSGGLLLSQQLRKFNGKAWDVFFVDAQGLILGIAGSTATKMKAIPLGASGGYIWTAPFKLNDASKIAEYMIQFVFNQKYVNDFVKFVKADFDLPSTLFGLQNIDITELASTTPGTYNIQLKNDIGSNLGDQYATELADPLLWSVKNSLTGAVISVTGVTYDAVGKKFVIVVTTTSPPYPAALGKIDISLVDPTALDTAGVSGYEAIPLTVVIN